MSKPLFERAALACALVLSTAAHAEILTFNDTAGADLPGASYVSRDGTYTAFDGASIYQGYRMTAEHHWYAGYINTILFCGGVSVNCAFDGTDHLISASVLSVERADGGIFALNAFDLGNTFEYDNPSSRFAVTGYKADGTTVSTTVTLDDLPNSATYGTSLSLNHFDFTGFTDLHSFQIARMTPNELGSMTLDNLDVSAVTPVPEPSTWLMMGLGLLGLGAHARRRKL